MWNASPFRMKNKKMPECRLVESYVFFCIRINMKNYVLHGLLVVLWICSHNPTLGMDRFLMIHSALVTFTFSFSKLRFLFLSFVSQIFRSRLKDIVPSIMYFYHGLMASLSTTYQQTHQNCPSPLIRFSFFSLH